MILYQLTNKFPETGAFTTTRNGGKSTGNYASWNLSPFTGDNPADFLSNLMLLSERIQVPLENIIIPSQTHETGILHVDEAFMQLNKTQQAHKLQRIDALISPLRNICIGVTTADCVPVLLYDALNHVVAAVHAGWRGAQARLVTKTIDEMGKIYQSLPENLFAIIGPSISVDAYQVGEELISEFKKADFDIDKIFVRNEKGLYLDLWKTMQITLLQSGVPPHQIELSGHCTFTENNQFFSARQSGIRSGRMYSGIYLK